MKYQYTALLIGFIVSGFVSFAQPYVVNEKVEKVFSEGFTDINKSFIITPSSDPKFWGTYGDGYYYMQRKIASPRAIIANADPVSKNFYIKSKILLNHLGPAESSVGLIFLAQKGGKGGFVFEFNKRKKFRIKDLGTGAFITKEGDNGWVKSKGIAPAPRNNTVEIKGFRGKFDIYINGTYIYSFVNSSYNEGNFGAYIGPNTEAKIYYYNVYKLDIPEAEPEVNLTTLTDQIKALKLENDSLKTLALTAIYGDGDKTAISAIKILEEQIQTVNKENAELKNILNEISKSENELDTNNQNTSINFFEKIESLTAERDSTIQAFDVLKNKLSKATLIQDSLNDEILNNKTEIEFMKEQLSKFQLEMAEDKLIEKSDSLEDIEKTPSIPSEIATIPKIQEQSDSIQKEVVNVKNIANIDSLSDMERMPSTPSKFATFPKTPQTSDSITVEVLEENKPLKIDSLVDNEKTPSVPSEISLAPKIPKTENKPESLDSVHAEEIDTARTVKNDSFLVQLKKAPNTVLKTDTLIDNFEEPIPLDTVGEIEIIKKDSVYMHTLNIDDEIGIEENTPKNNLEPDSINIEVKPLKKGKIKVKKSKKTEKTQKTDKTEKVKD